MSFNRQIFPKEFKSGEALTADMIGIGMLFSGSGSQDPNTENTLVAASIEGLIRRDGRVMALLTDWISVHASRINADRLIRIVLNLDSKIHRVVRLYWCATAQRLRADPRFVRLRKLYRGPRLSYLGLLNPDSSDRGGHEFLLSRNGEDDRFKNTCLIIPNKVIRHRLSDILNPSDLTRKHLAYRYRVMMGSSYRADMWGFLSRDAKIPIAELARRTYGSYNTAKEVKADFELFKAERPSKLKGIGSLT